MVLRLLFSAALAAVLFPASAAAHPVNYKDAFAVMPTFSAERRSLELNYSVTSTVAAALNATEIEFRARDARFFIPAVNYRLFRRNELGSQTNVYASLGAGGAEYRDSSYAAGRAYVQGDYETRHVYTLFSAERLESGSAADRSSFTYRAGVAPYVAGFDSLHTWLIGQLEYMPGAEDEWTVTPLVRFFYRNYLLEMGSSIDGDLFAAAMFHF